MNDLGKARVPEHPIFSEDDIGRIGRDVAGVRFMVLDHRSMEHPYSVADKPDYIVVLPGSTARPDNSPAISREPGRVTHFAWLRAPIYWEPEQETYG